MFCLAASSSRVSEPDGLLLFLLLPSPVARLRRPDQDGGDVPYTIWRQGAARPWEAPERRRCRGSDVASVALGARGVSSSSFFRRDSAPVLAGTLALILQIVMDSSAACS